MISRYVKHLLPLAALLLPLRGHAFDAVKTWTGGGNANFFNPPNWSGGTRPDFLPGTDTDSLLFNGTGTGSTYALNVNGTQTAYEVKSWLFTDGTYIFNNTQNLTLGDTTAKVTNTGWLTNAGTGTITFNNASVIGFRFGGIDAAGGPVVLGANPVLNVGFGLSDAGNNLTVKGSQPVTIGGVITGAGTDLSPGGVLVKDGDNTLFLNGTSSLWGGRVLIGNGAVRISKGNALGSADGRTSIAGDLNTGRLELLGSIGLSEPLHLSARASANPADHVRNISGNNLLAAPVTLDAGGTEFALQSDAGLLTLSSTLSYGTQTGASTLRLLGGGDGLLSGVIGAGGSALGIVKEGSGTWTLSGANAYTGPVVVKAGRLNVTTAQTGTGAATLEDGATLGLTLAAVGQSFTPSAVTLGTATGAALALDLGSFGSNPVAPVIHTGALTVNGTTNISIKAGGLSVGQFPLLRYTSITGTGAAGLALASLPARVTANLVDDAANSQVLLNVSVFDFPRWTGSIDGTWDADDGTGTGTANWREFNSGLVTRYLQGPSGIDGVRFDDSAVGPTQVNLSATLTPASVRIVNDVVTYTFTGAGKLSGAGGLSKEGPGKLILLNTGINDYTGTTTISGGTVEVGDGLQAGGGSLGTGPVINDAVLILNRPDNYTLSGPVSGSGPITKKGAGVTTLSGTSSFTGVLTVTEGTLRLGNGNALGSTTGGTHILPGTALDLNGQLLPEGEVVTIEGDGIGASGALLNVGSGGVGVGLKNLVLTGPATIGGSARWDIRDSPGGVQTHGHTLTKTGTNSVYFANVGETGIADLVINGPASRLVFEGDSTFGSATGTIVVETGAQLGLENSTTVNTKPIRLNAGTLRVSGGITNTVSSTITLDTVGTIDVATNAELLIDGKITGTGNLVKVSTGVLKITSSSHDYVGTTQISAGQLWIGDDTTTGRLPEGEIVTNGALHLRRTDTALVLANPISGTGTVVLGNANFGVNTQTVTITGSNTFTGAVNINRGFLRITNSAALGVGPKVVGIQSNKTPTLVLNGTTGDITLDSTIAFNTSSDGTFGAILNEAGNNAIGGPINLRNGGGGNTRINVLAGSLALNGPIAAAPDATSARTLILDGAGDANVVNGIISNATSGTTPQNLALTKTGPGTWSLNAANTYTGNTAVQAGVLRLGPLASIATSPVITLTEGATLHVADVPGFALAAQSLSGSGAVHGALSLPTGAILTPGGNAAAGTIAIDGGLSLAGGTLRFNPTVPTFFTPPLGDRVTVAGDLTITAPSVIDVPANGAPLTGTYRLIDYTGALNGDTATLTVVNTTRYTATLDTATPGQVNLVIGGSLGSLVWSGNGTTNTWDNTTTSTHFNGGTDHFFPIDAVLFDDTSLNTTVAIVGTVQPSSVIVDGVSNYTFNGTGGIGGVGSLTKTGPGILTLNTANAFTGQTHIGGGSLVLGTSGRLTGTRWIVVDQGTVFDVSAITAGFTLGGITDQRVLSGRGTIHGLITVNSAGVLKPGDSSSLADIFTAGDGIGTLTFTNDLTLAGAATPGAPRSLLQVAGPTGTVVDALDTPAVTAFSTTLPVLSDYLAVGGVLSLDAGSTLRVELAPGYTPAYGDVINLADWTSLITDANADTAGFNPELDLDLPALPSGLGWDRSHFTTHGLIVVGVAKPEVSAITFAPDATVDPGTPVTLSVVVLSPVEVTYQWRKDGSPIQSATAATHQFTATEADEGSYTVAVTNIAGTTVSASAAFSVNDPASVATPPVGATRNPGQSHTFQVVASGTAPFSYRWRKGEQPIDDATTDTLTVSAITEADQGDYDVVVTNSAGSATSAKATLSVNDPVVITTDPQPQVTLVNGSVTFSVAGTGTGPFTYQWRKGGSPIQGATDPTYSINSASFGDQATYDVVVTNSVNSDTSAGALLEVITGIAPRITVQPAPRLVALGAPLTLQVTAVAAPPVKYQWFKDGKLLPAAIASSYTVPAAALTHAGAYTVKVTSTTTADSTPAPVAVVNTNAAAFTLAKDSTATLPLGAAGASLDIQWTKDGEPLPVDPRLTLSADRKTLKITKLAAGDTAIYRATVTAPGGQLQGGQNNLKVFTDGPTLILPVTFPAATVGAPFSFQIPYDTSTTDKAPTSFTAKPLPAGLKLDAKTGLITGKPTASVGTGVKPYTVTIVALNAKGKSTTTANLVITALPTGAVGSFTGPLGRDVALNADLGGRVEFTSLSTAAYSGKLYLGTGTHPFSGSLTTTVGGTTPQTTVQVARKGSTPLTLAFTIDANQERLTSATLTDGTATLPVTAWRKKWLAKTQEPLFKGYYTLGLDLPETLDGDLTVPQGSGYASFTVAPAGTLTLAGRLPDGEIITGSTFAGPEGEIAVFKLFYASKGSIIGTLDITPGTQPLNYTDSTVHGLLSWYRPATATRLYAATGIGPVDLQAAGSRYLPPVAPLIALGLNEGTANARIAFTGARITTTATPPDLTVSLGKASKITLPLVNPDKIALTLAPATGAFSGTFNLSDPIPESTQRYLRTKIAYQGLIVNTAIGPLGFGYYLLPQLPSQLPAQTPPLNLLTTPILSGQVVLEPASP